MIDILMEAERYVEAYFREFLPGTRFFHNFQRTKAVVEICEEIAAASQLPWSDSEALFLAAWFHDTGYCHRRANHIEGSVRIAWTFLEDYELPSEFRLLVSRVIRSTTLSEPTSELERILKDADDYMVSSQQYSILSQLLRQELEWCDGIRFTDDQWTSECIGLFKRHRFHTTFANSKWTEQKQKNMGSSIGVSC